MAKDVNSTKLSITNLLHVDVLNTVVCSIFIIIAFSDISLSIIWVKPCSNVIDLTLFHSEASNVALFEYITGLVWVNGNFTSTEPSEHQNRHNVRYTDSCNRCLHHLLPIIFYMVCSYIDVSTLDVSDMVQS